MPFTVIVRSTEASDSGSEAPALTFDGTRVVIGRGDGCDIRLPDPSVSHRHATIRVKERAHVLVDEGSTNGTFVGKERLTPHSPHALKPGELFRLGRVWLEMRIDETPATRDLSLATRDLALLLVSRAMRLQNQEVNPEIHITAGAGTGTVLELAEEGRIYTIGRGNECDLVLDDADTSREHVHVTRRGGAVLVRDAGSKNGAKLGDVELGHERDVTWRGSAPLRVGRTTLSLHEPVALALSQLEGAEDEPFAESDLSPPPGNPPAPPPPEPSVPAVAHESKRPSTAPKPPAPGSKGRRSAWSKADVAVIGTAVAILALSIAGLVWLLHG